MIVSTIELKFYYPEFKKMCLNNDISSDSAIRLYSIVWAVYSIIWLPAVVWNHIVKPLMGFKDKG